MAFDYTLKQKDAINHEGENILVSAGAGSGKTAVLTARVIRKIRDGVPVTSLVILTFTNAAAAEMKERIRKALFSEADENPVIKRALESLDSAHIRTFDSYAYYLLKKYGHHKNISKKLKIGEPAEFSIMKKNLIDRVFEDFYKSGDQAFTHYLDLFSYKDSSRAKNQILYFHEALSLHYDKEAFMNDVLSEYFTRPHFETLFSRFESNNLEEITTMKDRLYTLFDEPFCEESLNYLEKFKEAMDPLLRCTDYTCVHETLTSDFKLPSTASLTRKLKDTPEESEADTIKRETGVIKAMLKKLTGDPSNPGPLQKSKEDHFEGYQATKPHIEVIIRLLRMFDERYQAIQKEEEHFDFSTVASTALDILYETPSVIEELKASINEIMVDEYQDTNAMQEAFLTTLETDNLYMVGDVKQSIYRFRHADPTIFMGKYEAYREGKGGYLIDLTENFRSRKEVLEGINRLFRAVMDETVGGVSYDERQALSAKNPMYDQYVSEDTPYGVDILTYNEEDQGDLLDTYSKKELEIFMLAHDIKRQVEEGMEIVGEQGLRPVTYGDYAVLLDRASDFGTIRKILEHVGVPLNIHRNAQFIDHDEVILIRHLLTLTAALDDPELFRSSFKHAFMSVMRSFAFEMDDDAIIQQVMAFPKKLEGGADALDPAIHGVFKPFFTKLTTLRSQAAFMPVDELLQTMIDTFDILRSTVRLQNTREAKVRLDYMVDLARAQARRGVSLNGFAKHLEAVGEAESDVELALKSDFDADTVHLMTIHKSKGLEFPVVYLPHLFNRFMHDTERVRFKRSLGFLIPYDNEGYDEHFLYPLYRILEKTEDVSERLRVLYVALTRAKERVVLPFFKSETPQTFSMDGHDRVDVYERRRYKSFHEVLSSVLDRFEHTTTPIDMHDYNPDSNYRFQSERQAPFEQAPEPKTYRFAGEAPVLEKRGAYSKGVNALLDSDTLDALDYGNRLHELFERIDFSETLEPQLESLHLIEREKTLIRAFFNSDLITSLDIRAVYKEYPFALETEGGLKSGFIDLLLETGDDFLVIDYKLKGIDEAAYEEQITGYVTMLRGIVDKPVEGYLYSILDKRFKQVI